MTKLNIIGEIGQTVPSVNPDGTYHGAHGGTELMLRQLLANVAPELIAKVKIICSRVRDIDPKRPNILWLHDTWDDPESAHLSDPEARKRFAKLVFVSHHQQLTYHLGLGVPYSEGVVIKNAITPFKMPPVKDNSVVRLIYHTTPHRGLELLVPAFEHFCELHPEAKVHLDVFSSFAAYGWPERDVPFAGIIQRASRHPNITYHGYKPNADVRKALEQAHIFAYPSIWPETSCIAAIEALAAGCLMVCPNYGALPETCADWTMMYPWSEDPNEHVNRFYAVMEHAITTVGDQAWTTQLSAQANYYNNFYSWKTRAHNWTGLLGQVA